MFYKPQFIFGYKGFTLNYCNKNIQLFVLVPIYPRSSQLAWEKVGQATNDEQLSDFIDIDQLDLDAWVATAYFWQDIEKEQ